MRKTKEEIKVDLINYVERHVPRSMQESSIKYFGHTEYGKHILDAVVNYIDGLKDEPKTEEIDFEEYIGLDEG